MRQLVRKARTIPVEKQVSERVSPVKARAFLDAFRGWNRRHGEFMLIGIKIYKKSMFFALFIPGFVSPLGLKKKFWGVRGLVFPIKGFQSSILEKIKVL